jgi:hypothetical protein
LSFLTFPFPTNFIFRVNIRMHTRCSTLRDNKSMQCYLFRVPLRGHLGLFFLCPNSPQFGHLNRPRIIFFVFSFSLSLGFFPLPPSRQFLDRPFRCRPTGLLDSGAPTSTPMSTSGQNDLSHRGITTILYAFWNFSTE